MVTIGFPRMNEEAGERRDFLPDFVSEAGRLGKVLVEEGYGQGLGIPITEYVKAGAAVVPRAKIFSCDYVLVIRCPADKELKLMRPNSALISMIHRSTHPLRVKQLLSQKIRGISMDALVDDAGNRLVEALELTAWGGMDVACGELFNQETINALSRGKVKRPFKIVVLGTGRVGRHAVNAAVHSGNLERYAKMVKGHLPAIAVEALGRSLTCNKEYLKSIFKKTDMLVDATSRTDVHMPIIPNSLLKELPSWAVILDIAADAYDASATPPVVKAIEGIPTGNLDKYIFRKDDPAYSGIPKFVDTTNRRTVVSCYSWPGLQPSKCMKIYGVQLMPLMRALIEKHPYAPRESGDMYERSLFRASDEFFSRQNKLQQEAIV